MSAPAPGKAAVFVAPRADWPAILRQTAIEVFSTMVGVSLTTPPNGNVPVLAQVTGMVGIAGQVSAIFSLRCSLDAAADIASRMLHVPTEEAVAQRCDAIAEICNIVAGYFKANIGLGDVCQLSLPTVLVGTDYQLRSRSNDVKMELPLLQESEPIWIALQVRP